ncbi:hypothetical protein O988_09584, partial [Pseudogymnoascus sp. VKM F-3808]
ADEGVIVFNRSYLIFLFDITARQASWG